MPIDTSQLDALVADVKAKSADLTTASAANDQAQAAAQAAVANAAATLAAKNTAHDALDASIVALETFLDAGK